MIDAAKPKPPPIKMEPPKEMLETTEALKAR